jgi:acetyl-CoA carboxylase biotin carboxylase subunit
MYPKLIEEPRHIEISLVETLWKACYLSERLFRSTSSPKLTEETPSPFMTDELRLKICCCKSG